MTWQHPQYPSVRDDFTFQKNINQLTRLITPAINRIIGYVHSKKCFKNVTQSFQLKNILSTDFILKVTTEKQKSHQQ